MSKTKVKKKKETKFSLFLKNNKYILISALIAFAVMQLVYFCFSLIPYGDMTILRMDLYHQYGPLFAELYDRLTSGESLIYSWNSGLGSSFLGNFYNYLSSPLSIIVVFFGHKNIPEAIATLILLKAAFASASFSYYLRRTQGRNDALTAAFSEFSNKVEKAKEKPSVIKKLREFKLPQLGKDISKVRSKDKGLEL